MEGAEVRKRLKLKDKSVNTYCALQPLFLVVPSFLNPTEAKILFVCSNLQYAVMLRYEASAGYETDASYLSMTGSSKKIAADGGSRPKF